MSTAILRRLLAGSALYALGGVASRLIAVLLLPVFTAYMSPAEYGALALLTTLSMLLVPLASLGLAGSIGISYFNTSGAEPRHALMWSAGWLRAAAAALLALVGWSARAPLSVLALGSPQFAAPTGLGFALAAVGVLALPWQLKLQFEERPAAFIAASLLGVLVTVGASLWLVVAEGLGAVGALAGALAGQASGAIAAFALAAGKPVARGFACAARELLRNGLPLVPSFFLLFVLQHGVRWVLQWTQGLDALGVYSVGASLGSAMGVLTAAFGSAWTPFALGHAERQDAAPEVLGRVTLYYVALFGFVTCLFFLFAEPLVVLLAHGSFRGAAGAVGLSAASQFLLTLFLLLLPPLYFARRVHNVLVTQSVAVLASCVLALWLVPRYGVVGAAASVTLSCLTLVVAQWLALRVLPVLKIRYDYGAAAVLFAVCAAIGWASFYTRPPEPAWLALLASALVAAALFLRWRKTEVAWPRPS
jgi:O-antigen/teichoic acid export membrane protein